MGVGRVEQLEEKKKRLADNVSEHKSANEGTVESKASTWGGGTLVVGLYYSCGKQRLIPTKHASNDKEEADGRGTLSLRLATFALEEEAPPYQCFMDALAVVTGTRCTAPSCYSTQNDAHLYMCMKTKLPVACVGGVTFCHFWHIRVCLLRGSSTMASSNCSHMQYEC
jgi:hypothetical protein